MDMLKGKNLLNKFKKLISSEEAIKNKTVIIFYFSAGWCDSPDCTVVLEKLKELHKENLKRNSGIEIIFVSSDKDQASFELYFRKHGGWYAVPFEDELSEQLRAVFGITNVPNLVVCKKNGEIITKSGRQEIVEKGINVLVTWTD